jgi:hypothetical protein
VEVEPEDTALQKAVRGVIGAPLTFAWLGVLFVTTRRQRSAGRWAARRIQRENSTNLKHLKNRPLRNLATSLFWLDGLHWWPYVPVYAAVLAPAERRLRWWRWLLVGIAAHVVGTLVGQVYLRQSILTRRAPRRLVNARDVGVSYFVFGIAGALTGYIQRRFRLPCQVAGVAALSANAVSRPTFTEVGHLTAFTVGLAAIPLAPDRERLAFGAGRRANAQ